MGIFKNCQGNQYSMQCLIMIMKLVCWLGWLSRIAFGQLEASETVTGSVSFPDLGITCLGNLAAFFTVCMRGMFPVEMGARDVLVATRGPKLEDINGFGLSTCREYKDASVVMLSTSTPNSSIKQFMKYISNVHDVESILLQCVPIKCNVVNASVEISECECNVGRCGCIVFSTVEEIRIMLARRVPGTLKALSDSLCLLPSLNCLRNGCHGCNQGLLHGEETDESQERLREVGNDSPAAVCRALDYISQVSIIEERICICIPVRPAGYDQWTKLLTRSFTLKDKEARGAIVMASEALKTYLEQGESIEETVETVEYSAISFILPRVAEVLVNLLLTVWFRVDGFSSSLVARKAVREYIVESKGNGFAANAFLTKALVNCNANNTDVCQLLTFRGDLLSIKTLSFMVGCGNLICSIGWAVLIAAEGGPGKWYDTHSMPPSKPRVALIMAAIAYSLVVDCMDLYFSKLAHVLKKPTTISVQRKRRQPPPIIAWAVVIVLETLCIVYCTVVAGTLGIKGFGMWLYSVVQGIVWLKWGIGSYLLGEYLDERSNPRPPFRGIVQCGLSPEDTVVRLRHGILMYCSSFLLNAFLAGVRGTWEYSSKGFTV